MLEVARLVADRGVRAYGLRGPPGERNAEECGCDRGMLGEQLGKAAGREKLRSVVVEEAGADSSNRLISLDLCGEVSEIGCTPES